MQDGKRVADMVDDVLTRQAKAYAARNGEPFEDALKAVVGTKAGRQLQELRSGPHRHERADEWQSEVARKRTEERAKLPRASGEAGLRLPSR